MLMLQAYGYAYAKGLCLRFMLMLKDYTYTYAKGLSLRLMLMHMA